MMINELDRINSYPKVYALGHKAILDIFKSEVQIEEKIDGSQFSFGVINGELMCRSKGKQLVLDAPEKMFLAAVNTAIELAPYLIPDCIYRCEYLQKPKHNTLKYGRIPQKHLIVFDIMVGPESYMSYEDKDSEAHRLGLECVPLLFRGRVVDVDMIKTMLDRESVLGQAKIEGVVVKNYTEFTDDKKIAVGKYVSERFKEQHGSEWKKSNPGTKDILHNIVMMYRTEARWNKGVQHLREDGRLEGSPRDIGALIKEVQRDFVDECSDEIAAFLLHYYLPKIQRSIIAGLPEWYKEQLMGKSFEEKDE